MLLNKIKQFIKGCSNKELSLDKNIFTEQEIDLFNAVKEFTISDRIYNYYIKEVRGNSDTTKEMANKKLITDIMLSREGDLDVDRPFRRIFYYGNLIIIADFKEKEIVWLRNDKGVFKYFNVDKIKKADLHRVLKIK